MKTDFRKLKLDAPDVRLLPDYNRPLPVDQLGESRHIRPRARAHLGVFEDTGRFYRPVSYERTPWDVVRKQLRQLIQQAVVHNAATNEVPILNTQNVSSNFRANGGSASWTETITAPTLVVGGGATAATENDYTHEALIDYATANGYVADLNALTTTVSTAKVYGGAGATIREITIQGRYLNNANNEQAIQIDRANVADTPIATGQTWGLEYVWQF